MNQKPQIYVIGNSHMDPVWLWRLREGRSTWLNTCRSVVKMMKKYPFLKFSRSSSACYQWIEASDPALFEEIRQLVAENRWEIVGGWVEQSDTIITPGEVLIRQAEYGKSYFQDRFNKDVKVAYSVDSFGQNVGLPKILQACGFDYYCWMRPQAHEKAMPDLFRWQSDDQQSSILSFRIQHAYCTLPGCKSFEEFEEGFDKATKFQKEPYQTFFFGIGDHGGGIYEKQLQWLLRLEDRCELVFSTLEDYFKILEQKTDLPLVTGEHTHHAPGCYSSASEIKKELALVEKNLVKAEKITLQFPHAADRVENGKKLDQVWNRFLFNYFHDIYPGTSTRISYEQEIRDLNGMANLAATDIIERGLCRVGSTIQSDFLTEGGVLLWNPLSKPTRGIAAFDTFCDPNVSGTAFSCLKTASGEEIPLQWIRAAVSFGPNNPWGRAVIAADLASSEFKAYAYGRSEKTYPFVGFERQKALLERLNFVVIADRFDTWGHGAKELGETLEKIPIQRVEEMENGPVVSRLRVHYSYKESEFYLDLFAYQGVNEVEAVWSGEWREKENTLKLSFHINGDKDEIVSGQASAVLTRKPDCREQPFQDFVTISREGVWSGLVTDALHSYDSIGSAELRLTVIRPVIYVEHEPFAPHGDEGYADFGFQEHRFWIFSGEKSLCDVSAMAERRLFSMEHLEITGASDGKNFVCDTIEILPHFLRVSAERFDQKGNRVVTLFNPSSATVSAKIFKNGTLGLATELQKFELKICKF